MMEHKANTLAEGLVKYSTMMRRDVERLLKTYNEAKPILGRKGEAGHEIADAA